MKKKMQKASAIHSVSSLLRISAFSVKKKSLKKAHFLTQQSPQMKLIIQPEIRAKKGNGFEKLQYNSSSNNYAIKSFCPVSSLQGLFPFIMALYKFDLTQQLSHWVTGMQHSFFFFFPQRQLKFDFASQNPHQLCQHKQ